jgi:hypothetical protein
MYFISKKGEIEFIDPKKRLNDKTYFEELWKIKYNIILREKKQNIIAYAIGKNKNVYDDFNY